jgi:purine-nucleoside phosphorylase
MMGPPNREGSPAAGDGGPAVHTPPSGGGGTPEEVAAGGTPNQVAAGTPNQVAGGTPDEVVAGPSDEVADPGDAGTAEEVAAGPSGERPFRPAVPEGVRVAAAALEPRLAERPVVALVLGSGLGGLAEEVEGATRIPAEDLPGMPVPRVPGHAGAVVAGRLAGVPVLVLAGRVHTYEGYSAAEVAFATRVAAQLGCRALVATNAAGGLNLDYDPADLMVLTDHISFLFDNPLRGAPDFVDLAGAYDPELRRAAVDAGRAAGLPVRQGVYLAAAGPSYETPAEIAMFRAWGADAVGMSTVPEVIAARAHGLRVAAISAITNVHRPGGTPTSHAEVLEVAALVRPRFRELVLALLPAAAQA